MKRIFVLTLIIMTLAACSPGENEEPVELVDYYVAFKEDTSSGNVNRYEWSVIIKEAASVEEIKQVAEDVVSKAQKEQSFNAIVIGFYDYEEFIGFGYTLGKATFAPNGDLAQADNVNAGDYNKMEFNFQVQKKDWDLQLTADEVEIWRAWQDQYLATFVEDVPEEETTLHIAEAFDIDTEDVDLILSKQTSWMFNDLTQ